MRENTDTLWDNNNLFNHCYVYGVKHYFNGRISKTWGTKYPLKYPISYKFTFKWNFWFK